MIAVVLWKMREAHFPQHNCYVSGAAAPRAPEERRREALAQAERGLAEEDLVLRRRLNADAHQYTPAWPHIGHRIRGLEAISSQPDRVPFFRAPVVKLDMQRAGYEVGFADRQGMHRLIGRSRREFKGQTAV